MNEYLGEWRKIREIIAAKMRSDLRPQFVDSHPYSRLFEIEVSNSLIDWEYRGEDLTDLATRMVGYPKRQSYLKMRQEMLGKNSTTLPKSEWIG